MLSTCILECFPRRGDCSDPPVSRSRAPMRTSLLTFCLLACACVGVAGDPASPQQQQQMPPGAADVTAPVAAISFPASGVVLIAPETISITADASDDVGVDKVEFWLDGALIGTDTTSPFSQPWPLSQALNGAHQWQVKAF